MESLSAPLALVVLVLDVLTIAHVWRSPIEAGRKIIWTLVIVLLPVVGLIMWAVAAGPFGKARL
ncbi:PLD nuclease N-terminal domain-containing protein [Stutzerimonas stutzeri]|uniref:PLD nuclease N-terminal domain-containing protein n=1 Tax=Stutzerimonas stutzeri TaxID=316 RepID=UPI00300E7C72